MSGDFALGMPIYQQYSLIQSLAYNRSIYTELAHYHALRGGIAIPVPLACRANGRSINITLNTLEKAHYALQAHLRFSSASKPRTPITQRDEAKRRPPSYQMRFR